MAARGSAVRSPNNWRLSAKDYIQAQIQFWETYHHHKEQMAFAATGLLLTGAAALAFIDPPAIVDSQFSNWVIFLVLVAMTATGGVFFVDWELSLREFAASMLRASHRLSVEWLTSLPSEDDLKLEHNPHGRPLTKALLRTYNEVKGTYVWHQNPRFIRILTDLIVVSWSAVAILRQLTIGFHLRSCWSPYW